MSDPFNTARNRLPEPANQFKGVNNSDGGIFAKIAKLWQPRNTTGETTVATVSRFTQRLIDAVTGNAYTADEFTSGAAITDTAAFRAAIEASSKSDAQQLRYRSCATRGDFLTGNTVNATGAVQTITSSFTVKTTDAVRNARLVMTLGNNAVNHTIKASIVVSSVIYPLFFNGSRTAVVSANGVMISDPVGKLIPKGTSVEIRVYADAGSGNVVQYNNANFTASAGGYWASSDKTDAASPGAMTGTTANICSASLLIGQCDEPCLAIVGDSTSYAGGPENAGWPIIAFGNNTSNAPHAGLNANLLRLPKAGIRALEWRDTEAKKLPLLQYADLVLVALGINDINTGQSAAQTITSLQAIYDDFAARGLRVWGATILPLTTSTDSWATVENQTAADGGKIATVNAWIRTTPTPLVGYVEASDAASSARDSGKWKAGYTTDGIHARTDTQTAREAIAAAVPSDILTRY